MFTRHEAYVHVGCIPLWKPPNGSPLRWRPGPLRGGSRHHLCTWSRCQLPGGDSSSIHRGIYWELLGPYINFQLGGSIEGWFVMENLAKKSMKHGWESHEMHIQRLDDLEVAHIWGNLLTSLQPKVPSRHPPAACSGAPDPSWLQHQSPAFLRGAKQG